MPPVDSKAASRPAPSNTISKLATLLSPRLLCPLPKKKTKKNRCQPPVAWLDNRPCTHPTDEKVSDLTMGGAKSKVAPHPARERVSAITTTGGPAVGNAARSSGSNQREAPVLSAAATSVQPSQTLQLEAEVQRLTTALAESKAQLQVPSRRHLNNRDGIIPQEHV